MILLVVTTLPDESTAAEIARQLVTEKYAACGTILPGARSIYMWNGGIADTREVVVIFKIRDAGFVALEEKLRSLHPYENPEIAAFAPAHVSKIYGEWVAANS